MTIKDIVANFLQTKRIDSFLKIRFLFFLHQHPTTKCTHQELAERLYLGNTPLLAKIITDLQSAGLVDYVENRYQLRDEPEVSICLQRLTRAFENPLARQEILQQMKHSASLSHYPAEVDEIYSLRLAKKKFMSSVSVLLLDDTETST